MKETIDNYKGLNSTQIPALRVDYGYNKLPKAKKETLYQKILRQINNPLIYILMFALGFDFVLWIYEGADSIPLESITIVIILSLNAFLGVWQEKKSDLALEKLESLSAPKSWVKRDNLLQHIPSAELLPGDYIRVQSGERIPADARVDRCEQLMIDESMLTGESVPIDKSVDHQVYAGTLVVRGHLWATVESTGPSSNMGKLASLIENVQRDKTPLEKKIDRLGNLVALIVFGIATSIIVVGLLVGGLSQFTTILLFAVALAVAAVPESLPAVMTLTLALGVERMAKRKAVVKRLSSVETLGSVTVIASDKTGTLTENRMEVQDLITEDHSEALRAMVIANDADSSRQAGDPMDIGLLNYAVKQEVNIEQIRNQAPRVSTQPFNSSLKFMRVTVSIGKQTRSYLKGAPDVLLKRCSLTKEKALEWEKKVEQLNAEGYRTLALASADGERAEKLEWLGLILLWDPPRAEVREAIKKAQQSGIKLLMITGDHPATANAIANKIGIESHQPITGNIIDSLSDHDLVDTIQRHQVFARMTPEHKLRVVMALKQSGSIVAVTGDGVNDAPALKAADVGIAMGKRGSDVSREVADLILLDDNFATIVAAIEEGRSIYENIQKFVRTLFSTNLAEVILIAIGAFYAFAAIGFGSSLALPLTAVQILWINLITDSLPALALAVDNNPGVMKFPPRPPRSPLLNRPSLVFTAASGCGAGLIALLLLFILPQYGYEKSFAQTTVFCFIVFVQLALVLPARKVNMAPSPNRLVTSALIIGIMLQVAAVTHHSLKPLLNVNETSLPMAMWVSIPVLICWGLAELLALKIRKNQQNSAIISGIEHCYFNSKAY